ILSRHRRAGALSRPGLASGLRPLRPCGRVPGTGRRGARAHGGARRRPMNPALAISDASFALCLALLLLAPLAIAGVALINTGLGRCRSAAQALLGNLIIVAATAVVFALIGATFAGATGAAGHVIQLAGKPWNWLGAGPLVLGGLSSASGQTQL